MRLQNLKIIFPLSNWEELHRFFNPETISPDPEDFQRCVARERGQEIQICSPDQILFALPTSPRETLIAGCDTDLRTYQILTGPENPSPYQGNGEPCLLRGDINKLQRGLEAALAANLSPICPWETELLLEDWPSWVLPDFTKRKIETVPMEKLLQEGANPTLADTNGNVFIKTREKRLSGICHFQKPLDIIEYDCEILPHNTPFFVSEPMTILQDELGTKEWRCFIAQGKLTSTSRYLDYNTNYKTPQKIQDFAKAFTKAHPTAPIAYTLDLAETPLGIQVIELNSPQGSGRYEKNDFKSFLQTLLA